MNMIKGIGRFLFSTSGATIIIAMIVLLLSLSLGASEVCNKDNKVIIDLYKLNKDGVKVLSIEETEYLKGYCTVVVSSNAGLYISNISLQEQIVLAPDLGVAKYSYDKNNNIKVESHTMLEYQKYNKIYRDLKYKEVLEYLNSDTFINGEYSKSIMEDKNTKEINDYKIFAFSSDLCHNCTSFKMRYRNKYINYLYLPLNKNDFKENKNNKFIDGNLKLVDNLTKKFKLRIGTPTVMIYSIKDKKFVYFSIGLDDGIEDYL